MKSVTWRDEVPRPRWWMLASSLAVLAFLASGLGLRNDFTYDDLYIVVGNDLVHTIHDTWRLFVLPYWPMRLGGDGYRPLTLLAFAVQWAIAPRSPLLFHAVTIVLYMLTAIAVFSLTSRLLPLGWAWLAAALFAVHPVHVEAVASVVGQAEVWTGLLVVLSTALYLRRRLENRLTAPTMWLIAVCYLAACLFKENGVVLPALLLLVEWLLIERASPPKVPLRPFYLGLFLVAEVYVVFRTLVIHKQFAGFSPFIPFFSLHVGYADRFLTMLGVVPQWARLILWPASLTTEYAPPAYRIAHGIASWQLSGALLIAVTMALFVMTVRRAPVIAFGIGWFIVTLLPSSNLILPSGILLAERTLFTPSVGALIAFCAALSTIWSRFNTPATRIVSLLAVEAILFLGVARSVVQTAVWRNNVALFTASVRASPNVYRSHYMLGAWLMANNDQAEGEREYLKAMQLFPYDPFVPYNLGQEYFHQRQYDRAYDMYERAERAVPAFQDALAQMALIRAVQGRYSDAARLAKHALVVGAGNSRMLQGIIDVASVDEKARKRLLASAENQPAPVVVR